MTEIQNLLESAVLDILILDFGLVWSLVLGIWNFVLAENVNKLFVFGRITA